MPELPLAETRCPLCGGDNRCTPALTGRFEGECWCTSARMSAEALARIPPEQRNRACLCPACAAGTQEAGE